MSVYVTSLSMKEVFIDETDVIRRLHTSLMSNDTDSKKLSVACNLQYNLASVLGFLYFM